jgi:hypothetical protein
MRSIQFLVFVLVFASTFKGHSQQENPVVLSSVNEVGITVDSIEELSKADWDGLFSMFEMNQAADSISLYFQIREFKMKKRENSNVTFNNLKISVRGVAENREQLKREMKKAVDNAQDLITRIENIDE